MTAFDEAADWVVVGSGAGSMSSGLLMRQAGKSVVILEKTNFFGGTTAKSGGVMWIPNNRFMSAGEDSAQKAAAYLEAVVGDDSDAPGTSKQKRLAYVHEAPKAVDFLVSRGVQLERGSKFWPDYYDELPGGCKTSRTVTAVPFNKDELGEWAPKLRQGFMEVPAKLDDGMKLPFAKHSWRIKGLFAKIAFRVVLAKLTGKHFVTAGAGLQGRLLQAGLKAGIDVRLQSPVSELVVENGRVSGVVTVKNGKPWRIAARLGVLVNAGGFAQNQAMRDRYQPGAKAAWSNTPEGDTGEMHLEMERIGGVLAQMDEMVGFQTTRAPNFDKDYVKPGMQAVTAKPHAILVDQSGVRYMNEGGSYELYCETMLKRDRVVPAIPSWAIMDSQFMEEYQLGGSTGIKKKPKSWSESGYLKQADTIDELATLIKVDRGALKGTVDRWNGFVAKGVDQDFHRGERAYDNWLGDPFFKDGPNKSMGRIETGPFYAVEVIPGDVGTYGGVVTDANSRVLRSDGSVIEGLYATGVATASAMGRVYPGAGASVGPSMVFGYIAAKHAAALAATPEASNTHGSKAVQQPVDVGRVQVAHG
jgi:3-oxosteroid 1-dehydrogenase